MNSKGDEEIWSSDGPDITNATNRCYLSRWDASCGPSETKPIFWKADGPDPSAVILKLAEGP